MTLRAGDRMTLDISSAAQGADRDVGHDGVFVGQTVEGLRCRGNLRKLYSPVLAWAWWASSMQIIVKMPMADCTYLRRCCHDDFSVGALGESFCQARQAPKSLDLALSHSWWLQP